MAKGLVTVLFFTLPFLQYALCTNTINGKDIEWKENNMIDVTGFVNKVLGKDFATINLELDFVNCRNIYYSTDSTITEFFLEKWEEIKNVLDTHFTKNCSKSSDPRINIAFRVSKNISDEIKNNWVKPGQNLKANLNSSGISSVIMDWSRHYNTRSGLWKENSILIAKKVLEGNFNITSAKVGIELYATNIDVYPDFEFRVPDFFILNLNQQFPLSIGLFQPYVQRHASDFKKQIPKGSEKKKVYYRFELEELISSLPKNVLKNYLNILFNYTLTIFSHTETCLILDYLHFSTEVKDEIVTQRLESLNGIQSIKPVTATSNKMQTLHRVETVFKSVYLPIREWACWVDCQNSPSNISTFSEANNCKCGTATLRASINATLLIAEHNFNDTLSYAQIPQSGNITIDKIVLVTNDDTWLNFPNLNKYIDPIRNLAMRKQVVCEVGFAKNVRKESTYTHWIGLDLALAPCRDLLDMNITNELIWKHSIQSKLEFNSFEMHYDFDELERMDIHRRLFQMKNPKINVTLLAKFRLQFNYVRKRISSSLYCDEDLLRFNQFVEILINWARVHDITLGLDLFPFTLDTWWRSVRGPEELVHNEATFVKSIRNFPKSMSNTIKIDPCLNKTSNVSETIPFAQDMIGVTLLCNVSTPYEFKVMLRFALFKFSNVEIRIGKEVENIGKVTTAMREIFHSRFDTDTGTQGRRSILIEMDLPEGNSRQQKYLQEFTMLAKTLEDSPSISIQGVHINLEENIGLKTHILEKVETNLKDLTLGVSFQNCTRELNKLMENASAAEKFNVKYVICQESRVVASNQDEDKVERLLDGCLVLKTAFHNVNPNLEKVYFQLELVGSEDFRAHIGEIEFLKFLNDVNKYGKGYNVSFLFPAFDIPHSGTAGWWRVDRSLNLSNPYAFSEKEGELLIGMTRRPNIPADSTVPTNITIVVILSVLGTAGAAVVVMASVAHRMKRNNRILSRSEEKEFLNGKDATGNESAYENLLFDKSYSLSKEEIQLDSSKILGAGNFGTVFKGVCRGNPVAVKAPNDGCSKEIFKSMLTEVKLLCYIGEHDNVIAFVGAYVKEISKGVIHIATALCENGSLQSYLRRRQTKSRDCVDNNEIEMTSMDTSELIKFSQQIASGMNYIAGKNVVHGDLATRNVLLDEYNVCKIADFGLARKLYEYNKYVKQSHEPLPWRWLSYESIKMMEFTTKSDVWSYGVTLWEIFSLGAVPYPGLTWTVEFVDELEGGMRMTKPKLGSNQIYEKMWDCWNISPNLRPTFADLNEYFASQIQSDYMVCEEQL